MENNETKKIFQKSKSRKCIKDFTGSEDVKYFPVRTTDFKLPTKDHVAKYNCDLITQDWNENQTTQRLLTKIYRTFVFGLPGRIGPIILEFLVLFYIFNYLRIVHGCVPSQFKSDSKIRNNSTECYGPDPFEFLKQAENNFSRILTWLIGVYVATTARRFWRQVSSLPRMDLTGLTINAQIWADPSKPEDEVEIIDGMTVKEFKMTISRWLLLSYLGYKRITFCFTCPHHIIMTDNQSLYIFNIQNVVSSNVSIFVHISNSGSIWRLF